MKERGIDSLQKIPVFLKLSSVVFASQKLPYIFYSSSSFHLNNSFDTVEVTSVDRLGVFFAKSAKIYCFK